MSRLAVPVATRRALGVHDVSGAAEVVAEEAAVGEHAAVRVADAAAVVRAEVGHRRRATVDA